MIIRTVSRFLLVTYFLEAGLLLAVAPWADFWDRHALLHWWPGLRPVVGNAFVRGAVTGVGVVTLVAGIVELATWLFSRRPHALHGRVAVAADSVGHGPGA